MKGNASHVLQMLARRSTCNALCVVARCGRWASTVGIDSGIGAPAPAPTSGRGWGWAPALTHGNVRTQRRCAC